VQLFSKETVSNLGPMISVCIKSMFMGIWGWWAFDIFTFMATYLGESQAAAQSIMRSIGLLTFMLPVGYSMAVNILTGNAIGEAKEKLAMQYYKVCLLMASLITVL
jgi:MATE family multidrug resistance protein